MTDALARRLLEAVLRRPGPSPARISLVGLCKNAGKTVTLNRLVAAAAALGHTPGLLSTGRDGEAVDAVTELPKPRVWAPAGALVATARPALKQVGGSGCDPGQTGGHEAARVEVLLETGIPTPLGPVVIGRVARPGAVLLVGPGPVARIEALLAALEAAGASLCLVDGSFDRRAAAGPAVTGRAVLAAGAAYSASMEATVAQVGHLLELFDLPPAPGEILARLPDAPLDTDRPAPGLARRSGAEPHGKPAPVALLPPGGPAQAAPVRSALAAPATVAAAAAASPPGTVLGLGGALTDGLLLALMERRLTLPLLVPDATHVLVSRSVWQRWRRQGGTVWVCRPVDVAAVTTNAYSPVGPSYDPAAFCARVAAVAGRPVADLVAGIAHNLQMEA